MKYECRIIGITPMWISILFTGTFLAVCAVGDNSVNWGYLGFEVLFPFLAAVVIGEWCKTRTDPVFDIICTQGSSLYFWIVRRFLLLFGLICLFALIGIMGVSMLRPGLSAADLLLTFLPTAFFLSSLSAFVSLLGNVLHISTMAAGIYWLFSIMAMSLLRFQPIRFIYLFARYAGINGFLWIINKFMLVTAGIILWGIAYVFCKKRIWG